jgi:phosphate-selective porin OprO and OprP
LTAPLLLVLAASSTTSPTFTAEPGKGITVASGDGNFSMNVVGRIVPRETLVEAGGKWTNEFNIRTARLNFTGNVLIPTVKYQLQLAFASNDLERDTGVAKEAVAPSTLLDAWIGWEAFRDLALRVGQLYVPFDRARTTREFALQFVDRQIAVNELSLDRDIGIYLYSVDLFGTTMLSYYLGVWSGDGRNRWAATRPGFLYTARVSFRPFGPFDDDVEGDLDRLDEIRLAIGGGFAYNTRTDRPRSTLGTPLTLGTFNYLHACGDLVFKYSGFSVFGEVLWRNNTGEDSKTGLDSKGEELTEWSRSGWGYFAQAAYMITAQLEAAVRWGEQRTIGETDPKLVKVIDEQGRELGGGLSLYLNGHRFKIQLDYFYLFGAEFSEGRHQTRLQLNVLL